MQYMFPVKHYLDADWDLFHYSGITNTGLTSFPGLQYIQSSQEEFILYVTYTYT